jgi:hypothetical protein
MSAWCAIGHSAAASNGGIVQYALRGGGFSAGVLGMTWQKFGGANPAFEPPETPAPTSCPFCLSKDVSTKSIVTRNDAYWRCGGCGQIWNPSRTSARKGHWHA